MIDVFNKTNSVYNFSIFYIFFCNIFFEIFWNGPFYFVYRNIIYSHCIFFWAYFEIIFYEKRIEITGRKHFLLRPVVRAG
jgi:hypothetical protein